MRTRRRRTFDDRGVEMRQPEPIYVNGKRLRTYLTAGQYRVVMTLTAPDGKVQEFPGATFEEARALLEAGEGPRHRRAGVQKHVSRALHSETVALNGNFPETDLIQQIRTIAGSLVDA